MIQAFAALAAKQALVRHAYDPAPLGPQDVEVAISHCGVCHSDLHVIDNDWATSKYPLVPGHEIVGTVVDRGADASIANGTVVGIGWQRSSCGACDLCHGGNENLCLTQQSTCVGHMGGFAERIRIGDRFVFPLPRGLDPATTAPMLCGGVTVFAPLRRWKVTKGATVGVVGIGGLGHLALAFLRAMECTSVAFTSSADKRDVALRMGAAEAASSKDARDIRAYVNRFDLLLCTAPAKLDWITYVQTLKPNGVLCLVGSPPGLLTIPPGPLLSGQRIVCGSDIGSPGMIREMLTFAAAHRIGAQIETLPLAEANAALARVRDNEVRYRMVLTV